MLLDAVFGRDVRVANLEVANSLVNQGFVQVTLEAVRQWEYEPTFLNGEPVEVATSIAVNYTLLP
ncbi:MAG: energy transducer TonB [Bryobacteraceae bacterium]|nr:energy transducer TonB [Bryobacteraceae bacterium]